MTDEEFVTWATASGVPAVPAKQLINAAASIEEMKEAFDAMMPAPPIYTLDDIVEMSDKNLYGFLPKEHGFVILGGCPNGDPVALDVKDHPGSIWYISHESMYDSSIRKIATKVAENLESFIVGLCEDESFPVDYHEAKLSQ